MKNSIQVLGTHNGISLIRKENGDEMYYSTKTKKTAIGIKGIARLLKCNQGTISRKVVTLGLGKEAEMYTTSGLKVVTLIEEEDLNKLFNSMLKSKVKQQTKDNVLATQDKFVQAGFRLMVLMEVAPELVAKEAISRIESPEKAQEVINHAVQHAEYLDSFHSLNAAGAACNFRPHNYGQVHGFNNQSLGVKNGERHKCNEYQKDMLTVVQKVQAMKLKANKDRYKNPYHAVQSARKAATHTINHVNEMMGN